ncbi:MAG TPA: carboxymuconolactone decarboxylase family protein [Candidatus Nitrosotalea sp.]|nr:carboxymuconolactone decarboxylase family protein [Candidatus Nitrosotalea sp.]
MDEDRSGLVDELLAGHQELNRSRGYGFSSFEWLARQDPDFEAERQALVRRVYTPSAPALPVKYRELIAAAVLAFRHYESCGKHLRRALREGASMQEVVEAMEVASVPGGMPLLHFALDELVRIEAEMESSPPPERQPPAAS